MSFILVKAGNILVTRNSPQCWVQSLESSQPSSFVSFHSSSFGLAIAFCSYLFLHLHPRVGGDWNWNVTRGAKNIGLIAVWLSFYDFKILRVQSHESTRHETKVYFRTSLTHCFEPCSSHCCFENEIGWSTNIISNNHHHHTCICAVAIEALTWLLSACDGSLPQPDPFCLYWN